MTPPSHTQGMTPIQWATSPLSKAPSSLDAPKEIQRHRTHQRLLLKNEFDPQRDACEDRFMPHDLGSGFAFDEKRAQPRNCENSGEDQVGVADAEEFIGKSDERGPDDAGRQPG